MTYPAFGKIPRLNRDVVITEKIDGTNALVRILGPDEPWPYEPVSQELHIRVTEDGTTLLAGSRKRWIHPDDDNHGFAKWVWDHAEDLAQLGPGHHYGEWWGGGINRGYGLKEKRFSLFNVSRWIDEALPECLDVVPTIMRGNASELNWMVQECIYDLRTHGSFAAPGYLNPEGIVVYHSAANQLFKATLEGDQQPKSLEVVFTDKPAWREALPGETPGELMPELVAA